MAAKRSSSTSQSLLNFFVVKKANTREDNEEKGEEQEVMPSEDTTNSNPANNDDISVGDSVDISEQTPESSSTIIDIEDSSLEICTADCCRLDRTEPYQPESKEILQKTKRIQGQGKNQQARYVQVQWFKQHTWLTLCLSRQKLYCYYCSKAFQSHLIVFSKSVEMAFVSTGFSNWRKATEGFRKHETSHSHSEAVFKLSNTQDIASLIDNARRLEQDARKEGLLKQLSSLRYLLRQGLAIRGHEITEGNLYCLLQLRAEDDANVKKWITDFRYLSPDIVNEQVELMANSILRSVLSEIHEAPYYAILADEATDINKHEQLCVCIRWVNNQYEVNEDILGLMQVPKTDSATLFGAIKDIIIRCILPFEKCRGQAYDGAANMSGHLNGVAARVKKEQNSALHVHCLAHSLNLCLQDLSRACESIRAGLHLVMELVQLIKWSPKRSSLFEKVKSEVSPDVIDLKPLCPTRWTVRTGAIQAILDNYAALCETLEEVNSTGRDEYAMKAGGFLQQMEKFETFFGLQLGFMVFGVTEQLSVTLQGKNTTVQEAIEAAVLTEKHLRSLRKDAEFDRFFENVVDGAKTLTEPPVLPRQRRLSKRADCGSEPHQFTTPQDFYRKQYFEVLDLVSNELSRRFDQKDLKIVMEMEKLILSASNDDFKDQVVIPELMRNNYESDLKMDTLAVQLKQIPALVARHRERTGQKIKKITNVRTLCGIMNANPVSKSMYTELHLLLKLFFTIPVTTATAERTFSAMRRLKTYLRSSMTQDKLNHVLLLNTYKSRLDDLNLHQIASTFISVNERHQNFFGIMK